ncbi:MAG: PSD1 and planctomycete cytochrome C domain-containing protein, partial [Planctomycetaceae bacterium]
MLQTRQNLPASGLYWLYVVLITFVPGGVSIAGDDPSHTFFEKQIRPLLVSRCYACHSGTKAGGGLSLESAEGWQRGGTGGPAIVPGRPEDSLLVDAIHYRSLKMPPEDSGGKLSPAEISAFTKWISMGAPDPRTGKASSAAMTPRQAQSWWAFQPLPQTDTDFSVKQLDTLIQSRLDEHGLTGTGPADKRTLIRRATYDLTGLPPASEAVEAFLTDTSADAFDHVVNRLLDSPQYGAHWGRHWLDVVRYADTAGENTDRPLPHAWRYRNWVLESFNRDLPFDQFVRLQIAGDIANEGSPSDERAAGIIATGYLAVARRFGHDIDKDIHLMHEDVIDNVGKNFLGLSLGCARCHDHKYDPVTAEDYYAVYGIFSSTQFSFPGCEPKGQPRDLVPLLKPAHVKSLMSDYQKRVAELELRTRSVPAERQRLKQLSAGSARSLTESAVAEGQSVPLHAGRTDALDRIRVRKGEVLQLTVLPNAGHGADTTRIEWVICRSEDPDVRWDVADLIPELTKAGPAISRDGARWCLMDVTDGPQFLHEKKLRIGGQQSLSGWSIGDTPSVIANAAPTPVSVWTTLPGHSLFMHPGHQRNVAVAWICPADGDYRVQGRVTDAHPAGLDGVTFRLQHMASSQLGTELLALGDRSAAGTSMPAAPEIPVAYAVVEGQAGNARLHLRGDPEQPGAEIPRRWLSMFGGEPVSRNGGSGRHQLAEWIVGHPLAARVMVNRVWQWHFGRGLVATPNDFGSRGEFPSHPRLLDRLTSHFQAVGFRIKPLHRLIMKSAAYRRSSVVDADSGLR